MNLSRNPLRPLTIVLALVAGAITISTSAYGHDIGWKWEYSDVVPTDTDQNTNYDTAEWNGYWDYNSNTDLVMSWCTWQCTANIINYEGDYGATGWTGKADPYSHGVECIQNPGYCNETDHQVDFAYILWNSYYGPYDSSGANYIARDEMGHVFGLAHVPCSTYSIMNTGCTTGLPTTLQSHDISDINAKY